MVREETVKQKEGGKREICIELIIKFRAHNNNERDT